MGHRFEIYTDEDTAKEIIMISDGFNIEAKIVGRVEESDKKRLTIKSDLGTYEY
jgi:phosphoribosylformylglycinamidine cyclo-ligase